MKRELYEGCCFDMMPKIKEGSIDLILADLPYGVTSNNKDISLPTDKLWEQYWRLLKSNGVVVLFGQDKFTAMMMLSDPNHKYNLIWDKELTSGFLNANKMPLRSHEDIMVFYKKQPTYNPQKVLGKKSHSRGGKKQVKNNNYGDFDFIDNGEFLGEMKHPKSILTFQKPHPSITLHRTEKPVTLLEWIIKTFTNEGALVLDNVAGSGSTGKACDNTNRGFILIEKEAKDCETIRTRLNL